MTEIDEARMAELCYLLEMCDEFERRMLWLDQLFRIPVDLAKLCLLAYDTGHRWHWKPFRAAVRASASTPTRGEP
jgi:hypothetical protein